MYDFFFTVYSILCWKKGDGFFFHEQEVTSFSPKSVWNETFDKSSYSEGLTYARNVVLSYNESCPRHWFQRVLLRAEISFHLAALIHLGGKNDCVLRVQLSRLCGLWRQSQVPGFFFQFKRLFIMLFKLGISFDLQIITLPIAKCSTYCCGKRWV